MSVYARLGLRPVVNAVGYYTALGNCLPSREVLAAMEEASRGYVDYAELQRAAGRRIADLIGADDAYVVSGAAAGLTLAAAAALAGTDPQRIEQLPDTAGMPNEIAVPAGHRSAYDHALRLAGARLVEAPPGSSALGPATVACFMSASAPQSDLGLLDLVNVAHEHGVPVIVDAALADPVIPVVGTVVATGADLVAVSGGKALHGPPSSGFVAGRKDLIRSIAIQHQDLDVRCSVIDDPSGPLWGDAPGILGIGRGFKAGKEEIAGLFVALEQAASADPAVERARALERAGRLADGLSGLSSVAVEVVDAPGSPPRVVLRLFGEKLAGSGWQIFHVLRGGDPPIWIGARPDDLFLAAETLADDEVDIVVRELLSALSS